MVLDVIIEDPRWGDLEPLATRAAKAALAHLDLSSEDWEITLLACDDARIAALNTTFRDKKAATNVLSWPSAERGADIDGQSPAPPAGDPELGDIAIAYDTCHREATANHIAFQDHVTHLVVHGVLHLLGYDHERNGDADLMESLETAILCKLGVPDPYNVDGQPKRDS